MSSILELIKRVEVAKGPDRELDEAIFEMTHGRKRNRSTFEQYDPSEPLPHYTSSLNVVITLVERTFPGPEYGWMINSDGYGTIWRENAEDACGAVGPDLDGIAPPTPALVLLLTFLRAKQSQ